MEETKKCGSCKSPGILWSDGAMWLVVCFFLGLMGILLALGVLGAADLLGGDYWEAWRGAPYVLAAAFLAGYIAGLLWGDFSYLFWDAEGKLHLHSRAPRHTEARGRFLKFPVMSLRRGGVYEWYNCPAYSELRRAQAWRVSGRLRRITLMYVPRGLPEKRAALSLGEPNEALLWFVNIPDPYGAGELLRRLDRVWNGIEQLGRSMGALARAATNRDIAKSPYGAGFKLFISDTLKVLRDSLPLQPNVEELLKAENVEYQALNVCMGGILTKGERPAGKKEKNADAASAAPPPAP